MDGLVIEYHDRITSTFNKQHELGLRFKGLRKMTNVHFLSTTDLWATPQDLFDELNDEFGFTRDVCAIPENAKCPDYFTPGQDGLSMTWNGICWMNPPYGREIARWMKKAYESSMRGATVVCLVPARTDTSWWHNYAVLGEIRFIKGRLKFGDQKNSAPFPSAIVVFRPSNLQDKDTSYGEPTATIVRYVDVKGKSILCSPGIAA